MERITPAQMEALTGLTVANQRVWHRSGYMHPELEAERGASGHRRYTRLDVLHVCTVRAIADYGLPLPVAAMIAEMCTDEISSRLQGLSLLSSEITHPYVLVFRSRDRAATADTEIIGGGVLHEEAPDGYEIVRLSDLNKMTHYTTLGGVLIISGNLQQVIPQAVKDFFTPEELSERLAPHIQPDDGEENT